MIDTQLKECCLDCKYSDVKTETWEKLGYENPEIPERDTRIWCTHEPVCKILEKLHEQKN